MSNLIVSCLSSVSKNINRKLTDSEIRSLVNVLVKSNLTIYNVDFFANQIAKNLHKKSVESFTDVSTTTNIDINQERSFPTIVSPKHITDILNSIKVSDIQHIFNPTAQYGRDYVVLDTINCSEILSNSRFRWRYSSTQNIQSGTINSVGPINNIVSMRIFQPNFPPLPLAATYNSIALVSLLIEEFSAQAFIASATRKYHYLMRLAANRNTVVLSTVEAQIEDYGDGIFNFKKPIASFDTLTISFADPIDIIVFPSNDNRIMFAIEFTYLK